MTARRLVWFHAAVLAVAATPAPAADLVGDFFDMSVERLPQLPRTAPLEVIFGEEPAFVGLTFTQQMVLTREPADPLVAIPLVAIQSGRGQERRYAIELDFTQMLTNLPAIGFPVDQFVSGTSFWFDDLELVDDDGNAHPGFVSNILLVGSPGANGTIEVSEDLRFADGNGVDPPAPSDTDQTGFGEVLVLNIPNGSTLADYPVVRIEFDLIPDLPGDFDRDGDVDLGDYVHLQSLFTGPMAGGGGALNDADFDADGDVDLADLLKFLDGFTGPQAQFASAVEF